MKLLNIGSLITLVLAFLIVLIYGYWLVYPYNPLVFQDPVLPVVTKEVKQGGTLFYTSKYCKYMDLTAKVGRSFVNDLIFATPEMTTNRETGCHTIIVGIGVPHELPPGTYNLENTYTYKVNPIREIVIKQSTESFKVIDAK